MTRDKANDCGIVIVSADVAWPGMMSNCEQQTLNGSTNPGPVGNPFDSHVAISYSEIYIIKPIDWTLKRLNFSKLLQSKYHSSTMQCAVQQSLGSCGTEVPARAIFFLSDLQVAIKVAFDLRATCFAIVPAENLYSKSSCAVFAVALYASLTHLQEQWTSWQLVQTGCSFLAALELEF